MAYSQKIIREKPKQVPVIIDERKPKTANNLVVDPATANIPVRAVTFIEVGDMSPAHIQLMLKELSRTYDTAKGGIHYVLPARHGKIRSDILFENECEQIGKELFEAVDENGVPIEGATIRLKGGSVEMQVIRQTV